MGPDQPAQPIGLTPEQQAQQRQLKLDQIDTLKQQSQDQTRDLLLRFGRSRAITSFFSGSAPSLGGL